MSFSGSGRPPSASGAGAGPRRQRRTLLRHTGCASGQRVWKRQPGGGLAGLGGSPCSRMRCGLHARVGHRHGRQQDLGVRMARRGEQRVAVGDFDDVAEVHHGDAVADVAHHRQVVRDEQVGDAELGLQVHQQVDHLRLHRDVERRHRLVADDQLRVQRQRAGDAEALALAAGELVRILGRRLRAQADLGEQPLHALAPLGCASCRRSCAAARRRSRRPAGADSSDA